MKQDIPKIPGVKPIISKGNVYLYHRATGERIRPTYGTPEFARELDRLDAKAGQPKRPSLGGKTLGDLIEAYRASPQFADLAPRTRADYQQKFDYLVPIVMMPLIDLNRAELMRIRDRAHKARKFHFANYLMTVFRLLLQWGVARDWLAFNPAGEIERIDRPKHLGRFPNRAWTDAEKLAVLDAAHGGVRTAIGLGMYAAMRESDALSVTWSCVADSWMRWEQQKTHDPACWPIEGDFVELIEEARRAAGGAPLPTRVIVLNEAGRAYTRDGFRANFFRLLKRLERDGAVGPGLTFHGLRHTAGKELVEAGGTTAEVQVRLGHRTLAMADLYSREFNRTTLAGAGAKKLRPEETGTDHRVPRREGDEMTAQPLISIAEAAERGILRLRMPIWADPFDHVKIDIIDGRHGPWAHLFCPYNLQCNGVDPVDIIAIRMTGQVSFDPHERCFEPYAGPLPESAEYKAAVARFERSK